MPSSPCLALGLGLALSCAMLFAAGCDTSAVGIDACRSIEEARCVAAQSCGVGIDSSAKLDECNRFARDNCLHGLPIGTPPEEAQLDKCVKAVQTAGSCAKKSGATSLASACFTSAVPATATVCEIVEDPEENADCAFLVPPVPPAATTTTTKDAGKD